MTTSLAAVFIPILFMSGILGRLFREFAVTITTAILISGVVSVTLTPMLCSRFLRGRAHARRASRALMERGVRRAARAATSGACGSCCATGSSMLGVFVAVLVATVQMFGIVPKGFIPDQDNDSLNVNLRAAQGTSFYEMVDVRAAASPTIVNAEPVRRQRSSSSTGGGGGAMNTARFNVQLTPRAERHADGGADRAAAPRRSCSRFPGFRAFVSLPPALQIGGRRATAPTTSRCRASNTDELYAVGAAARGGDRRSCRRCRTSPTTWR